MTRPPHSSGALRERSSPDPRKGNRVRSNALVQGCAERQFWDFRCRTPDNGGRFAWRPLSEGYPLLHPAFTLQVEGYGFQS